METPKHLNFFSPCVGDDSDHTPSSSPFVSQGKSPRKRSASEALAKEESKKRKKNKKLDSSLFKRIWNEEDELLVLKGLVDYRIKSRNEPKIDWDGFYRFLGGSIVAKFSKEHVLSKIRKLKRRFIVHLERINERKDPNFTTSSDSEAFGFSMMLWGPIEAEVSDADVDKEMSKEQEEELINENGVAEITENGTARKAQQSEEMLKEHEEQPLSDYAAAKITNNRTAQKSQQSDNGEEMLKEHEEVAIAEPLHDNGAAKITENGDTTGEAQQSKSGEEMLEDHEEVAVAEHFNDNGALKLHDEVVVDEITENGTAQKAQQSENGEEMLKEHEEGADAEPLRDNGAAKIMENGTARKAQQNESDEEMLKEHEEVTNAEPLNDNGAAKVMKNGTTAGKESHDDDDELCALRDAFETMMSQGLSDYQKKLQLKKLMSLGTAEKRQLSDEWKALCAEERRLNIKKLRFSAKIAELANESWMKPRRW